MWLESLAEESFSSPDLPRVIFDCNVYLAALISPKGAASACFDALEQGRFLLYISGLVWNEIWSVSYRDEIREGNPALTDERVEVFWDKVLSLAVLIQDVPSRLTLERDQKDEKYLDLADEVGANYLVCRDKDPLDLMKDQQFREQYPTLTILDPSAFLREIRREVKPEHGRHAIEPSPALEEEAEPNRRDRNLEP